MRLKTTTLRCAALLFVAAALAACQPLTRPTPKTPAPPAPATPAPQPEIAPAAPLGAESRIALLLPQRGAFTQLAEMVRDGFFAALYSQQGPRPSVRVYDTGANVEMLRQAIRQATADGARFIVGPLQKDMVTAMAAQGSPPVPVLALNYLDASQHAPGTFYQLGLAPEDEARAAATQAVSAGFRRAAALTPQNEWGERILNAFSKRLAELGGELVSAQRYGNVAEISQPIRALMALPESDERRTALAGILGKLEFEPRRRDDLDFVFVAARADQGRLVIPQLRFHRLGSLPVFATAQVFDNGTGDSDLSGLRSCDMPMMVGAGGRYASLRAELSEVLPGRTREQQRLFALGYDAYQLVGFLHVGPLPASGGFPAATGDLGMGANGAISRNLQCAELARSAP
jgi:outer membrane PBP1 activator LpoA protein